MISKILRDTLAQVIQWENDHPDDARGIAPGLVALKFHLHSVLHYIEQPTARDLEDLPDTEPAPRYWTGRLRRH